MGDAKQSTDYLSTMLGGAMSGALARIPTHPLDTIKAQLQVGQGIAGSSRSLIAAISKVFKTEGVRGFYRGIDVAMLGSVPASMLYFSSYEACRDALLSHVPALQSTPSVAHFAAGMVAESVSCVLWVPIDVLKERSQVGTYSHMLQGVREALQYEGVGGLYRGYAATLASFGPFSALYFAFYEPCKALTQRWVGYGG